MSNRIKYIHEENVHNLKSPMEIVPVLVKLLTPKSVVDFGCGLGTFLYCFKIEGVKEVLGLDGSWVNKELLNKYISHDEFLECNLEEPLNLGKRFDLAISLEVAEHIPEKAADIFIENLVSTSQMIVFSASVPNQDGQNHINEQWLNYWEQKFSKHNYIMHDILRPLFWDNPNIFWWYKQNMVLVTSKESNFQTNCDVLKNVIHYEFLNDKSKHLDSIVNGSAGTKTYLKYLVRSVKKKFLH